MPYRNRVTPLGDIVAIPLRGAWTGNRGIVHSGHEIVRPQAGDHWITCALRFKDRYEEQWKPRRLTWLFFHDEAVSFAAGHRPCGECRHRDYTAYRDAWAASRGEVPHARQMSRQLHRERPIARTRHRRLHEVEWNSLPDGAFVLDEGAPALVLDSELVRWGPAGYGARSRRPRHGNARVITPPSTLDVLRAGYPVQIDASARRAADAV
ncbi:hypothetical protein AB0C59_20120 [Streptomyces sp. NPDC048664]|uniref:hypothetical protein n=1 Tax=Streptomyces sp. NPDC048664 TaxID=3154505 RepID=UPI00343F9752